MSPSRHFRRHYRHYGRKLAAHRETRYPPEIKTTARTQSEKQDEKIATIMALAAQVSHEVNNPLQAITSYADLLLLEENPEVQELASAILEASERVVAAVRHVSLQAREMMIMTYGSAAIARDRSRPPQP